MNTAEIENKVIEFLRQLPLTKQSSVLDYVEYLVGKNDDSMTPSEIIAYGIIEAEKDRKGEISLPTLEELLNELRD